MSERENPSHLLPATFEFLVVSLRVQAELAMAAGPKEEEDPPDFNAARHVIDLLGVLQEKTKGNLTFEEQRLLENSLTELRFRYVQAWEDSQKQKKTAEAKQEAGKA